MHRISKSFRRDDAAEKISGRAVYISDINPPEMLNIALCTAEIQHGKIKKIKIPKLPQDYAVIDKNDFNGMNRATIVAQDWPFFAEDEVTYFGQPVIAVAGPSLSECERLCAETEIEYEQLTSVSIIEEASECFNDYTIVKGDPDKAFAEAAKVVENTYKTGMQEQAYMEPQGMIAYFNGGILTVEGSMQCPYYIKNSLMNAFNLDEEHVRVIQSTTGGAFGGKEDYPSVIAGHVAAASIKTGRPVKMVLDRHLDIKLTPKRHPSLIKIRTALDSKNLITAMDIDCKIDAGAYQSLSGVVLERAIFISTGAYNIENIHVRGRTMKTNHIPSGAFRGFGGPQALFAADMNMEYLSGILCAQPLELRERYLFKQGDLSVTSGTFRDEIKLDEMIERINKVSDYKNKWLKYNEAGLNNHGNDEKLRGIGISFAAHGGAFTGSGEQDIIKSLVKLKAEFSNTTDYNVHILVSNVEMGQGASLTLRKIVAETMLLPLDRVLFTTPDTSIVPDSGPTVASRTIMIVGKLLQDAGEDLSAEINKGNKPIKDIKDKPVVIERRYVHPEEFEWDEKTFTGDAYPGYSWSVNVIEVEVDPLTYEIDITGSWAVYDVGTPIDLKVLEGQMQGGTTQSLGYSSIENLEINGGKPAQCSFTDYTIPTTLEFPDTECHFIDNPYRYGPFGAKAAGELPNEGPAAAFVSAVSQAVGKLVTEIPVTPEKLEVLLNE